MGLHSSTFEKKHYMGLASNTPQSHVIMDKYRTPQKSTLLATFRPVQADYRATFAVRKYAPVVATEEMIIDKRSLSLRASTLLPMIVKETHAFWLIRK